MSGVVSCAHVEMMPMMVTVGPGAVNVNVVVITMAVTTMYFAGAWQ